MTDIKRDRYRDEIKIALEVPDQIFDRVVFDRIAILSKELQGFLPKRFIDVVQEADKSFPSVHAHRNLLKRRLWQALEMQEKYGIGVGADKEGARSDVSLGFLSREKI